ncbi:hypothetical protein [Pedobacter sp.]|uniref:hypothetical protein n=1 Tax=Pedobacter sp. TaxID=1411316 RepID=UPI0031D103B7
MAKQTLNIIKNWFKTGLKPTQAQFWDTWDSFWHKDETIPTSSIENLDARFNQKADQEAFQSHLLDTNAHGISTKANAADLLAETQAREQADQALALQIAEMQGQVVIVSRLGEAVDVNGDLNLSEEELPEYPRQPTVYVDEVAGSWQTQYNKSTKVLTGLYGISPEATIEIIF